MRIHIAVLTWIRTICAAFSPAHRAASTLDASAPDREFVYGNPQDTCDPLNPSNKGLDPRVVDHGGNVISFPLKASGAQLYYGDGQPMRTNGELIHATGSVRLNYGMRLEREGRTYFMAWQTNHDDPADSGKKNATGWVAADDMADDGAAAKAAIPHRLGNVERPLAKDPGGKPRTFVVNGTNEQATAAAHNDWKYTGVHGHHDKVINFFNLHNGSAGLQMLVNLPNVPGGGIAQDCLPNGTLFTAAADQNDELITKCIPVRDKHDAEHSLTFIYGTAGDTWGWIVKDWLD
jgi:hypothetical protein